MRVHVAARSKESAKKFSSNNPAFVDCEVHLGSKSLFDLLNKIIFDYPDDVALFVHDDIFVCREFINIVEELVLDLDRNWPGWGVCGNAGFAPLSYGADASNVVRCLQDPHGGPTRLRDICPVETVDGNTILLNCRALRQSHVRLPSLLGFHLYDVSLCIEALAAGLGVLVAPQLACMHASGGDGSSFRAAVKNLSYERYLQSRLNNRTLTTLNGLVSIPYKKPEDRLIDIEMQALRNAAVGRSAKTVAIVIRTQFRSPSLLRRALDTAGAFRAAAGTSTRFKLVLITDRDEVEETDLRLVDEIIRTGPLSTGDTRNLLIRHVIRNVEADYFWFVDDDDWLFPNEAERVALAVASATRDAAIFIDCQAYHERLSPSSGLEGSSYTIQPGHLFASADWARSLSGNNHIPMCGMLLSKTLLDQVPDSLFDRVVYFEDYTLLMVSILTMQAQPILVQKLTVGVSIRRPTAEKILDNTPIDRTVWNQSYAELLSQMCARSSNSLLISFTPFVMKDKKLGFQPLKKTSRFVKLQAFLRHPKNSEKRKRYRQQFF
ncbi:glycosyltransferase family 2 protein [Terrihabitans sp. B22-R8]|uniref:glycosyltransferase family 2 protein n=1 Tax=Terrihabitans sp. B22-R8 TaxID=3425128 RepID=UPI00403CC0DB